MHCSGIGSPAQPRPIHGCGQVLEATESLPLSHNATEGDVASCRNNLVLRVHLHWVHLQLIDRTILSLKEKKKARVTFI